VFKIKSWVTGLLFILFLPLAVCAQNQEWQVYKSTHFFIFYKNAPEAEVNALMLKAEDYYNSIANEFGFNRFNFWTWDNRAKIYLYDNQDDYRQATQSTEWSGGQVRIGAKLIQGFSGAPGFLNSMLPHELAHIIFIEMVGFNNPAVPLWLQEGVATYQQEDISAVKADLAGKIRGNDYLDLRALNSFQLSNASTENVRLFYAESYSMVKYLIAEFGKDAFVNFCRLLRDNRNLMTALSRAYSFKNLNEFEESWKNYILK